MGIISVHVGSVRQTASILYMSSELLRTGDKAIVRFRFIKNPEYLRVGMRMVFREGRTKAVGNITKLYPHISAVAQNTRQQRAHKKDHQHRPQNEPQKPSKRNRRSRNKPYLPGEQDCTEAGEHKENHTDTVTVQSTAPVVSTPEQQVT